MGVLGFWRRGQYERAGFSLYGRAVAIAREPYFYRTLSVPDTLDGRFDLIGLHVCLLIRRLQTLAPPGPDLAQAVFDAMFRDMDGNLREMGVGDLSVGRRVRQMWEALHGRAAAYGTALDAGDPTALASALARNVWRGEALPKGSPEAITRLALAQDAHLKKQPLSVFLAGNVSFLLAAEAGR